MILVFIVLIVHVLSQKRPGLNPRSVHVNSVVHKVATGLVFLRVILISPVSINLPFLHNHLHLHVALTSRTKGRKLEPSNKNSAL